MEGSAWNKDEIFKPLLFAKPAFNKHAHPSDIFDDVKHALAL